MKIYEASHFGVRIKDLLRDPIVLDPSDTADPMFTSLSEPYWIDPKQVDWLQDHCPTHTVPVFPFMFMVDEIAKRVQQQFHDSVITVMRNVKVHRWLICDKKQQLKTKVEIQTDKRMKVILYSWRESLKSTLSRFEPLMTAEIEIAKHYPTAANLQLDELMKPRRIEDPYGRNLLFHGPSLQVIDELFYGTNGSKAKLNAGSTKVASGLLNPGLLDGITYSIPHDNLSQWSEDAMNEAIAYPYQISSLELYSSVPVKGVVDCEVRFAGFMDDDNRFPQFNVLLMHEDEIILSMKLIEIGFPKGKMGLLPRNERKQFLQKQIYVEEARLSDALDSGLELSIETMKQQNWLPGTLEQLYDLPEQQKDEDKAKWIVVKEYVAEYLKRHPSEIQVWNDGTRASHSAFPLMQVQMKIQKKDQSVFVTGSVEKVQIDEIKQYWREKLKRQDWIIEDLFEGLTKQFISEVHLEDAEEYNALNKLKRPVLYLANHQTAIESLLFIYLTSALSKQPISAIAKIEHQDTWIGELISNISRYPELNEFIDMFYFDRQDQSTMLNLMKDLKHQIVEKGMSMLVHLEGTRALNCRQPVQKISSTFIDLAIQLELPIVPVRFVGGLPIEPLKQRSEFPHQYSTQSIHLGRAVFPEDLIALPYAERNRRILDAVNAAGVCLDDEQLYPKDATFHTQVKHMMESSGMDEPRAVLRQVLENLLVKSSESLIIINRSALSSSSPAANDVKSAWLENFSKWLYLEGRRSDTDG